MKSKKIFIVLMSFLFIGIAFFSQILARQEEKRSAREIFNKGNQIVNLIALHSLHDFEGNKRNFFIRTLMEYTSYQGLVYCFITDHNEKPIVSLVPKDLEYENRPHIQTQSASPMGSTYQSFNTGQQGREIYEFSKPIYEDGEKTGTVRIGLKPPGISIFSIERLNQLAMLLFLIVSAVTIVYFGLIKTLKPLEQFSESNKDTPDGSPVLLNRPTKHFRIGALMDEFDSSMVQFKNRLEKIETDNKELSYRIGVLKYEKNQVFNILNSINFGIIITDIQDNVNHINDYMLKLLNKTRQDVIDAPLAEVIKDEKVFSFISRQEGIDQVSTPNQLDTTFPDVAPGEIFMVSCSYLMNGDAESIGTLIMFNNITREKTAEKATLEFTAHLSHELITPLTTIKSYSEMLMDGEIEDSETLKEFYNTINSETTRLSRLIKDMLNLSMIELGSMTLNKGLVKSDWLFEDCIKAVEGSARKKNISIQRHLPDNFPSLIGDKEQLKAAVINILSNAVKYTPANGEIHFALREENNMVVFDIKDTGYGMTEEDLSHIFEKFYRSDNPQITEQQGTGLGLAITSEIIGLHDGEISVQSELGSGTHFSIKIPKEAYYLGK